MPGIGETLVQQNALTGTTYILDQERWREVDTGTHEEPDSPDSPTTLPRYAGAQLEGWGGMDPDTEASQTAFTAAIYNGSDWTVKELTVRLSALDAEADTIWTREYRDHVHIAPLSVGTFEAKVLTGQDFDQINWTIYDARGSKTNGKTEPAASQLPQQ